MDINTQYKIKSNLNNLRYLREKSYWYKYLNRDRNNYDKFLNAYKRYNRSVTTNKVNDTINNIDMVTNILKVLE